MILRLIKGLSYTTPIFSVKNGDTVNVSEDAAEKLLSSGHFEVVVEKKATKIENKSTSEESSDEKNSSVDETSAPDFDSMKASELDAYAEEHGIQFTSGMNKTQKIEHLRNLIVSI